jgi:hypothetical protein
MKQKNCIGIWWLTAGAATFASTAAVGALEASDWLVFSKGPVSLRPQFELVEQFTDNVYYLDRGRIADFVTIISPGVRIVAGQDMPKENHFILNYNLDELLYIKESQLDGTQHRASTDIRYAWSRLSIEGADRVEFLSSALGGGFSQSTRRPVDRFFVSDLYRADYSVGPRTGVYVEAQHGMVDYERGLQLFDSRKIQGTGGFEYLFSRDTRFFGEVYYGVTELDDNGSGLKPVGTSFVGGFVGARGQFTEKLTGRVKGGYEVSTFSGGSTAGLDRSAGQAPVVEANISYLFTDRSSISFTYNRRQQVSVQFRRSSYSADQVSLGASEVLGSSGRLRLTQSISYQNLDFDPFEITPGAVVRRSDSSWNFDLGASWFFQTWLSTRLGYSHERYSSDLPSVIDYTLNRVTLSLAIGY